MTADLLVAKAECEAARWPEQHRNDCAWCASLPPIGDRSFDRLGELIDTTCECDEGRACNYPPCVMSNDLIGRAMHREYLIDRNRWDFPESPVDLAAAVDHYRSETKEGAR